jgi:predicted RNA-binding Zn-ribbon protein involved in translation (DUF1610 family)
MARSWQNAMAIGAKKFRCGSCGELVVSNVGYSTNGGENAQIYICPNCNDPTMFTASRQVPGPIAGNKVEHLPKEIDALYLEARNCVSVGSNTSAVLTLRKLLMHIAVSQGAKAGEPFIAYTFGKD